MRFKNDNISTTHKGSVFFIRLIWIMVMTAIIMALFASFCILHGFAEEMGEDLAAYEGGTNSLIITKKINHIHTGNSDDGGGCYTVANTEYRDVEVRCPGKLFYWGKEADTSECTACGASYFGDRGGESCPHSWYESKEVTTYSLGCGKGGKAVGEVTYTIAPTEWTREVSIDVAIENNGMKLGKNPYRFQGQSYESGHFTITENGNYALGINADSNSNVAAANYTAAITNIDRTGPVLQGYDILPSDWTNEEIQVVLGRVVDLQPDGSNGAGVADCPYSFDGGNSWTDVGAHSYSQNGSYTILIRDRLGNTAEAEIKVGNIDNEAPRIDSIQYDSTPNIKSTSILVECSDVMSDGRYGCGLDEEAYSFDGGKNWTSVNELYVDKNGDIEFAVRDRLGNTANITITIDNLDVTGPEVAYTLTPDDWTNKNVTVTFSATDINENGKDGIGLPRLCYSYDGGRTWTDSNKREAEDNGNIPVIVRDLNDNYTYYGAVVDNIDRIPPSVSITCKMNEDGNEAMLVADVSDEESGIELSSLHWKGNGKHSNCNYISVRIAGGYNFHVADRAGNETVSDIRVDEFPTDDIPIDAGPDGDGDVKPPRPPMPSVTPIVPQIDYKPDISDDEDSPHAPEPVIVSEEELTEEESEIIIDEAMDEPQEEVVSDLIKDGNSKKKGFWDGLSLLQKILVILLLLLLLFALILLLILYARSVVIYCEKEHDEYAMLGIKLLRSRDGHYYVDIDEAMWNKAESTHFRFKFNQLFLLLHDSEDIYINFPGEKVRLAEIHRKTDVIV